MTTGRDKMKAALDKKHEAQFEKAMYEALKQDPGGIHFDVPLEENPRLQVFNEVMREQARKKVN